MAMTGRRSFTFLAAALLAAGMANPAIAAKCGNNAGGFNTWIGQFKSEAVGRGISPKTLDRAFNGVGYATKTISLDRNQRSFKLSLQQFLSKRGASSIISKGRQLKNSDAALFRNIEKQYGVPPGPLIAIWGMESGFGSFMGNQHTMSAVATLAYDCRRSEFFTDQLYALLDLIQRGWISPDFRGAAHGEIGQTQFLPRNVINYGKSGDGNRSVNLRNKTDALVSTANFLRAHGWRPGGGYQPGEVNFDAIRGWNAAGVYQQAIAIIGAEIDK